MSNIYIYGPEFDPRVDRYVYRLFCDPLCKDELDHFILKYNLSSSNVIAGKLLSYYWISDDDPIIDEILKDTEIKKADTSDVKIVGKSWKKYRDLFSICGVEVYPKILLLDAKAHKFGGIVKDLKIHPSRFLLLGDEGERTEGLKNIRRYAGVILSEPSIVSAEARWLYSQECHFFANHINIIDYMKAFKKTINSVDIYSRLGSAI